MATKLRKSDKWNKIYVSPDLTVREREVNRALRDELKRRRANGEQNLIIKRGRIVSTTNATSESRHNSQPTSNN